MNDEEDGEENAKGEGSGRKNVGHMKGHGDIVTLGLYVVSRPTCVAVEIFLHDI